MSFIGKHAKDVGSMVFSFIGLAAVAAIAACGTTVSAPPFTAPPKAQAAYLDPRILSGDAKANIGKNIILSGEAQNVTQQDGYTWISLSAEVGGKQYSSEPLVVELYPKNTSILKSECYRIYGVVQGSQQVTTILTGANRDVPYVRGYAWEPGLKGNYGIGCAAQ